MRIDKYIQEKYHLKSRTYAENLILLQKVTVNGKVCLKPSMQVDDNSSIDVDLSYDYASQGARKLLEAIKVFEIDVSGKSTIDLGCSNGGFCDVLLRNGAKSVLGIDVGDCALPDNLLSDKRLSFLKANARELPESLNKTADIVTGDLSFISLKLILPSVYKLLKQNGESVLLIKPQFEVGKSALSKDGIVIHEKDRNRAVDEIKSFAQNLGFSVIGTTQSPAVYEGKNIEYLVYLKKVQQLNL